jgi:hypothetical protein
VRPEPPAAVEVAVEVAVAVAVAAPGVEAEGRCSQRRHVIGRDQLHRSIRAAEPTVRVRLPRRLAESESWFLR